MNGYISDSTVHHVDVIRRVVVHRPHCAIHMLGPLFRLLCMLGTIACGDQLADFFSSSSNVVLRKPSSSHRFEMTTAIAPGG